MAPAGTFDAAGVADRDRGGCSNRRLSRPLVGGRDFESEFSV
jgi:hypothetical protein